MCCFSSLGIFNAILRPVLTVRIPFPHNMRIKNLDVIVSILNVTSKSHLACRISNALLLHGPLAPIECVDRVWCNIIAICRERGYAITRVWVGTLRSIHFLLRSDICQPQRRKSRVRVTRLRSCVPMAWRRLKLEVLGGTEVWGEL